MLMLGSHGVVRLASRWSSGWCVRAVCGRGGGADADGRCGAVAPDLDPLGGTLRWLGELIDLDDDHVFLVQGAETSQKRYAAMKFALPPVPTDIREPTTAV